MDGKITKIITESGAVVEASSPVIISASRVTDIPAFFSRWFINRLQAGYCVTYNRHNNKPEYISFDKCKVVVFWTKNPKPLIPLLNELDNRGIHYYFQFTLNDYSPEGFEPNVPDLEQRVEIFRQLSNKIGKESVIWRYDPFIISPQLPVSTLLERVKKIGDLLRGSTEKLVFSFVDLFPHLSDNTLINAEIKKERMQEIAEGLSHYRDDWANEGWPLHLATCAEQIDLQSLHIEHNRCIDEELMKRIWSEDKMLMYYLNFGKLPDNNSFNITNPNQLSANELKDPLQRLLCGCMVSKDIGMYNTCQHFCVYCYANKSNDLVKENKKKHDANNECMIKQ